MPHKFRMSADKLEAIQAAQRESVERWERETGAYLRRKDYRQRMAEHAKAYTEAHPVTD